MLPLPTRRENRGWQPEEGHRLPGLGASGSQDDASWSIIAAVCLSKSQAGPGVLGDADPRVMTGLKRVRLAQPDAVRGAAHERRRRRSLPSRRGAS